jgi:DMSO/TMAO reductase YedYZ heme-binding membrane subunit
MIARRGTPFAVALILSALAIAMAWAVGADATERAGLAARWTARSALPLFLIAFTASALVHLWPGAITRALLRRRRQWGLAFALAHSIHLIALAVNLTWYAPPRPAQTLIGGGLAYAFIYLMALTSNDRSQRLLGHWWRRLHAVGAHYIWLIFTISYAGRIVQPGKQWTGVVFTAIMLAALGLRLWARRYRDRSGGQRRDEALASSA